MILSSYVSSLVENIDIKNCPGEIDLVLDGGAFNGIYMIGALFYIKELERREKIKINRISGASIGSILGLLFLLDKLDLTIDIGIEVYKTIRKTQHLLNFKNKINDLLMNNLKEEHLDKINNKFYITYFDTNKNKQIIKKKYKNCKELKNTILKSMHFPYLLDKKMTDNEGCVDGSFPYIFKQKERENKKILFINLQSLDKIINMLYIKKEKNIFTRIFTGLMDTHNFFYNNKNTKMCSYVNNWGIKDILFFRLREIIYTSMVYILTLGLQIEKYIPNNLKKDKIIIKLISIFKNVWRDILIYMTL